MAFLDFLFKRKHKRTFIDLSGQSFSDEEYNRIKHEQEAYALDLLRKISTQGQQSLNKEEQAFLEAYSQSNYLN